MTLDRTTPPPTYPIGNLSLPSPEEKTLPNGTRLLTLQGGDWNVCNLAILYPGGFCEARSSAVPMLCATLLAEGSEGHSGAEINDFYDFHGAYFGAMAAAHYTTVMLSWLPSMGEGLLPLTAEILAKPTFPEEAILPYKQQLEAALLAKQAKTSYKSLKEATRLIMGPDNANAMPETVEEIHAASRQSILDWHKRVFTAKGAIAFLSGKFSDETVKEVEQFLMSLPAEEPAVEVELDPYRPLDPQTVQIEMPGAMQCSVAMAMPAPPRTSPDYVALRFATIALGGYFGSRLMMNIREDKGYTYGINAALLGTLDGSYIQISADTDKKYLADLVEETKKVIESMATVPLSPDELQSLVQHVSSSLLDTLNSPFAIMDYYRTFVTAGIPDGYFQAQLALLKSLTPQTIMDVSAKYLRPELLRIAITS